MSKEVEEIEVVIPNPEERPLYTSCDRKDGIKGGIVKDGGYWYLKSERHILVLSRKEWMIMLERIKEALGPPLP